MAEFSLDRFKYRWRGSWSASQDYRRDDIVTVKGKSYVCLIAHTSSPNFRTDLNAIIPGSSPPVPEPKWVVMTSGKSFLGNWASETDYDLGDIVLYNGTLYKCTYAHTSSTFSNDAFGVEFDQPQENRKWDVFSLGQDFIGNWVSGTDYGFGDLAKYGGYVYKCQTPHTAGDTLEDDQNKWTPFYNGYQFRGPWLPGVIYYVNDYVRYGASLFVCNTSHTSEGTALDETKFDFDIPGTQYEADWDSTVNYNIGDIVRYGGTLYYAINNNIDSNPSKGEVADTVDSTIDWIVLAKTFNFRCVWGENAPTTERFIITAGVDTTIGNATGAIYIDGVAKGAIDLTRGNTYLFVQGSESLTNYQSVTHPLKITQTLDAPQEWPDAVKYILDGVEVTYADYVSGFATAKQRILSWTVGTDAETTP